MSNENLKLSPFLDLKIIKFFQPCIFLNSYKKSPFHSLYLLHSLLSNISLPFSAPSVPLSPIKKWNEKRVRASDKVLLFIRINVMIMMIIEWKWRVMVDESQRKWWLKKVFRKSLLEKISIPTTKIFLIR